jgi:hypothetical protein
VVADGRRRLPTRGAAGHRSGAAGQRLQAHRIQHPIKKGGGYYPSVVQFLQVKLTSHSIK